MRTLKPIAVWLAILLSAMLNGLFREAVLLPHLDIPLAFVLSGLLLSSLILLVAIVFARWMELISTSRCISVGLIWAGLTLAFEFGFGGVVQGRTWAEMLEAYTFKDGNIWPLVLVVTFVAPFIAARVRATMSD